MLNKLNEVNKMTNNEKTIIKINDAELWCYNDIDETSAFLINIGDNAHKQYQDDFYADIDLDLSDQKNCNWKTVASHIYSKYPNADIQEIISC